MAQRELADIDDEERTQRLIQSQIQAGSSNIDESVEEEADKDAHVLIRAEDTPKVEFAIKAPVGLKKKPNVTANEVFGSEDVNEGSKDLHAKKKDLPAIEKIMRDDEERRVRELQAMDAKDRLDYWLCEGLIVKIMNKVVGEGRYYKQKGVVVKVIDRYVADVHVEFMALLRLDQDDLETVMPKVGAEGLMVNGRGRGCRVVVLRINEEKFNCDVRVLEGTLAGRELTAVEYEDICKLHERQ